MGYKLTFVLPSLRSVIDTVEEDKEKNLTQRKQQGLGEDILAQQTKDRIFEGHGDSEMLAMFTSAEPDWIYEQDENRSSSSTQLPTAEARKEPSPAPSLPKLGCNLVSQPSSPAQSRLQPLTWA